MVWVSHQLLLASFNNHTIHVDKTPQPYPGVPLRQLASFIHCCYPRGRAVLTPHYVSLHMVYTNQRGATVLHWAGRVKGGLCLLTTRTHLCFSVRVMLIGWGGLKLSLSCMCYYVWWMCEFSSACHCVYIHASPLCECFHKERQGVKYLFEHMLEGLLRAVRQSTLLLRTPWGRYSSLIQSVCISEIFFFVVVY